MLELSLLGELRVQRDGVPVPLPASRKSRALLAYLAATARPHLRERLCELLWEGPDDPRGALRWSLAKLRPLVSPHLVAARDRIEFRDSGASVDVRSIASPSNATNEQLEVCASLYRGEFLEGLDLPECFRYQQWCVGERERHRQQHIAILSELTRRYDGSDAALVHARRRVLVDPFNEDAHAALIRLLASLGHSHEAMRQYEQCRQLFERELNARPGHAVEQARAGIGAAKPQRSASQPVPVSATPFVGREPELAQIESSHHPVLLLGEPGIGKSRLVDEVRARTKGTTVYGRAYAAEMVRPYGVWIDALGDFPVESDRTQLFESIVRSLANIALVAIDDIQWIDESSAALLHYVARSTPQLPILCAARAGEVDDNPHAKRLMRHVRFTQISLGPLSESETRTLVDDERAVQLSAGNPLFALELARSQGDSPDALTSTIAKRVGDLSGAAGELVSWAAAVGRRFDIDTVGRATGMPAGEMLGALERLERLAVIRAAGENAYDFVHDLVRDGAYRMITGPRRTLVHRHIARALRELHDPDGARAGEVMHHASLAGEHELAVQAAVDAGKRCLRLFAYSEAIAVARRGLSICETLSGDVRIQSEMRLLYIIVFARTPLRERVVYAGRIAEVTEMARSAGLAKVAALGAHLLAELHEEANDSSRAADETIRSAELSRDADPATSALSLATTARCLLLLERDIPRAEELIEQAKAMGTANHELTLALGYLHAHHGRTEEATIQLEHAFSLATRNQDHWRQWVALVRLVTVALESGEPAAAIAHCTRLRPVAAKMAGGSEAVRGEVLEIVARHAGGQKVDIERALQKLREVDSKSDLAWVLSFLAQIETDRTRAKAFAAEALVAAEAVGRASQAAIARCILGKPVKPSRDVNERARQFLKESANGRSRSRAIV
jgi:DNA-binding SARP family transcriptional activator